MSACRKSLITCHTILSLDLLIKDMMMEESCIPASLGHSCSDVYRAPPLCQALFQALQTQLRTRQTETSSRAAYILVEGDN